MKLLMNCLTTNSEIAESYKEASELGFSDDFFIWSIKSGTTLEAISDCKRYKRWCEEHNSSFDIKQFVRAYKRYIRGVCLKWNTKPPESLWALSNVRQSDRDWLWYGDVVKLSDVGAKELSAYGDGVGDRLVDIWVALGYLEDNRRPDYTCCGKKPNRGWKYCPYCGKAIPK